MARFDQSQPDGGGRHCPERLNFAITGEVNRAHRSVILDTFRTVVHHVDPFDLALAHSGPIEADQFVPIIQNRIGQLQVRPNTFQHQMEANVEWFSIAEAEVAHHVVVRLDADIAWHASLLDRVPDIARESRDGPPGLTLKEDPT